MERRSVEASIRKNDATPGRSPSLGYRQARTRTPITVDVRIDENDDARGQRVTVTEGGLELPGHTPSGWI